jgi:hypothetical protein
LPIAVTLVIGLVVVEAIKRVIPFIKEKAKEVVW